jgi:hypothetical protein
MKEIVSEHGWPTVAKVGQDGTRAAWLLVQHADHDPAFQRLCLTMMQLHAGKSEVSQTDLAYLTDRVLVNEGKEQVYGTQFHVLNGVRQPRPIKDPDNVDKRRRAAGMNSLKEYTEFLNS